MKQYQHAMGSVHMCCTCIAQKKIYYNEKAEKKPKLANQTC